MCNVSGMAFAVKNLGPGEVRGKRVIEVGSLDVNGSLRPVLEAWEPAEYVGVDILEGPGVDVVCGVENLVERFGAGSFDLVVSTELLEHVRDWRGAVANVKNVCRPQGIILITTRSYGFPYHGYPHDFWRFELQDMEHIFSDCQVVALQEDCLSPGVFVKVVKPREFEENDLSGYELYSVVVGRRTGELAARDFRTARFRRLLLREWLRRYGYRTVDFVLSKV